MQHPLAGILADLDDNEPGLPPGTPPTQRFEGPWFTTQLLLSTGIGLISFLVFSYCRTRWPLQFAPRTKLKGKKELQDLRYFIDLIRTGFSPHEAHAHQAFFGWIFPTIRTSEFSVLQIVGLDAAVLLNFFKMSFWLFSTCSIFAVAMLMPLNLKNNIDIGDGSGDSDPDWQTLVPPANSTGRDWLDLVSDANSYLSVHLLFTYLFTLFALYFINKNYKKFVRSRQLFSLELVHSISARTVMVTHLPSHLRGERALAEYFENLSLCVESVSICREVGSMKQLLDKRTAALLKLESAWVKYIGNPSTIDVQRPSARDEHRLVDVDDADLEASPQQFILPDKKRPTMRPGWFKSKVDTLEYLEKEFREADELVKKKRGNGRFKATHVAFVTFEEMSSAQIAAQVAHAPIPNQCITHLAPEPRDIVWSNITHSPATLRMREWMVFGAMCLLLFFWLIPTSALASLLSYKEIKKTMPWLGDLIDANEQIRAIVQNSLPSVAIVTLNALLPFLLEALTYVQGYPARSWIEYSLLRKYFLFLLVNVVFIFLVASTYWQLVRDFANSPAKVVEKLADALAAGKARHFFVSYVILQGLGIMPLQLLSLGILIPRFVYRMFVTRTPRDFAELNAPPMINYGVVYPQAILIFVITLLYSVIQPLILLFGALYFGVAYVVYKYKLLFVFYKPYESHGQAWPITFARLIWGVIIFIVFMMGIFILKRSYVLATLLAPLLAGTLLWSWYTNKTFQSLSEFVNLSSVFEVQRGEDTADVVRLRAGHPVSWSQSNLNRRRYAQNDETLYVAPEDERTDYSQPPMANWYSGVLNTGKRRYGHPALNGVLPSPWLPQRKRQDSTANGAETSSSASPQEANPAVVVTLRKRPSVQGEGRKQPNASPGGSTEPADAAAAAEEAILNPWQDVHPRRPTGAPTTPLHHRLSFDHGSGVIVLPEEDDWLEGDSDSDDIVNEDADGIVPGGALAGSVASAQGVEESVGSTSSGRERVAGTSPGKRYSTYFHHPERRKGTQSRS
ncbi:uncharacterized protein FIBRA_08801 [Fibroporia radiculosa]|uniref:CSC1/OSCA1-like 7TM region domain-containing protein n=1 Tax=Fibroporia radiculosa TaxID=599839 RepID=J4GI98_9APHY|nr:uncharacterized protein FIBRA_08801 [Fibroporia radiculosa]CCM06528.1 predicted protein [Fibroporia radiculosa]